MDRDTALNSIETGHAIYAPETAKEISQALGVPFKESLVRVYESDRHPLGLTMYKGPADGVWSLELARHVADCLGLEADCDYQLYLGRGTQARAIAEAVRILLSIPA